LHAPQAEFGGVEFYPDFMMKAAVLCAGLDRSNFRNVCHGRYVMPVCRTTAFTTFDASARLSQQSAARRRAIEKGDHLSGFATHSLACAAGTEAARRDLTQTDQPSQKRSAWTARSLF
jgi:hypothetical protein